jgi:hypothetical protein
MVFDRRSYALGESIDIDIVFEARRDVLVKEGRVDLVCQDDYKQTTPVTYVTRFAGGYKKASPPLITMKRTRQITRSRNETYSHSSTVFLTDTRLRSGETTKHNVRLDIDLELPQTVNATWSLVVSFDVAQARNVSNRQPITINASSIINSAESDIEYQATDTRSATVEADDSAFVWYERGKQLYLERKYDQAIEVFIEAMRLDTDDVRAQNLAIYAHQASGIQKQMREAFAKLEESRVELIPVGQRGEASFPQDSDRQRFSDYQNPQQVRPGGVNSYGPNPPGGTFSG